MTLVETMSPPVTPSVDCVLNRNGGEVRGPGPELCSINRPGEVQGECPQEG